MDNIKIMDNIKMMDNGGALSVDFIFTTLIILIVIGSILTVVAERMAIVGETEELGTARMLAENVAEAINKAYSGGDGHVISIALPPNINEKIYQIRVDPSGVFIEIDGNIGKAYIVPKRISNALNPTSTEVIMLAGKNYNIYNVKDTDGSNRIVITQI